MQTPQRLLGQQSMEQTDIQESQNLVSKAKITLSIIVFGLEQQMQALEIVIIIIAIQVKLVLLLLRKKEIIFWKLRFLCVRLIRV